MRRQLTLEQRAAVEDLLTLAPEDFELVRKTIGALRERERARRRRR